MYLPPSATSWTILDKAETELRGGPDTLAARGQEMCVNKFGYVGLADPRGMKKGHVGTCVCSDLLQ